eukprot:gene23560-9081_t
MVRTSTHRIPSRYAVFIATPSHLAGVADYLLTMHGYGVKASQGHRQNMEDTFCVQERVQPLLPLADDELGSPARDPDSGLDDPNAETSVQQLPAGLSWFGVYDGHGGHAVAQHCSARMHHHFSRQLRILQLTQLNSSSLPSASADISFPRLSSLASELQTSCSLASKGSDAKSSEAKGSDAGAQGGSSDAKGSGAGPQGGTRAGGGVSGSHIGGGADGLHADPKGGVRADEIDASCSLASDAKSSDADLVSEALRLSFILTDEELLGTEEGEDTGATAVVGVVGKDFIWVGHCGDSRAVIRRKGGVVPLTRDHKPDREDEASRVKAAGGRIVRRNGAHRIMGMLAVSRSIGDHYLRPYVIAEPEVVCVQRCSEDEVLLIATDGLWDVFSNEEAANLAARCISRSKERGMSRYGACRVVVSVLTKVAMERGSRDNITIIVLDISLPATTENEQGRGLGTSRMSVDVPSSAPPGLTQGNASMEAEGGNGDMLRSLPARPRENLNPSYTARRQRSPSAGGNAVPPVPRRTASTDLPGTWPTSSSSSTAPNTAPVLTTQ